MEEYNNRVVRVICRYEIVANEGDGFFEVHETSNMFQGKTIYGPIASYELAKDTVKQLQNRHDKMVAGVKNMMDEGVILV